MRLGLTRAAKHVDNRPLLRPARRGKTRGLRSVCHFSGSIARVNVQILRLRRLYSHFRAGRIFSAICSAYIILVYDMHE